ncbi:Chemotaxis protein PomA [Pirellulimonas nuda]|uniref:Chemotaxis protein PomA n=1 Tax=Pirellulimonas nuda TaxID=2528009 RepID=A0A518D9Q6_9BACT|nr:motility protein A [Pirellulimonas nuda]QDU88225.1 Chemotaxis protein PomA [Pirellulimonas nuda]
MDIATAAGVVTAIALILASIVIGGGKMGAFVDPPSVMVVVGGGIAATLVAFPLKNFLSVFSVGLKVLFYKSASIPEIIDQIVSLAETARRDGLLALEGRMSEIENEFVALGVQMAVDGARPEVIEDVLRTEVDGVATRHRDGKALFDTLGRYAPAFGMIGTLMGLIIMLGDMSDPSKIGAGMAVALLTTLYGAIMANVICLPFADKLGYTNKQELLVMEIVIRGIMAIQQGENPKVIRQKLTTFVPPKQRGSEEQAA